ncbi:MAG: glycosyltransferase family 39 protein [Gammaproteobacteria bacterium]|nr:glycosyltransferase family 39 protein [Gammaproteobacteria bacterium]MBU1724182.1 glycosyltransferase family 39 protein [Gammaproteobacteria bacterium]MBU2006721.1 glycosyltransferase family 39 protein [Gammaproteobacteria bacterium]
MRPASGLRYWLLRSGDVFLLPLVLLAFFWQLGTPALFDLDEGAFSAATWEMLQRGDFITTFLNGEPRFDKPILIYWLQAISVSMFGLHEWTLRLPSALAASAWVMATYYFAKPRMASTMFPSTPLASTPLSHRDSRSLSGVEGNMVEASGVEGNRPAILAALMVATAPMILVIGRAATADAVLNLLIALTLFDIWRYWENPTRMVMFRVFFWLGLGFLCKGPIAVAIPFVTSAFLYLTQYRTLSARTERSRSGVEGWKNWLKTVFHPYGLTVFLAIAAPWYILEYLAQGQAFIDGFFFKHNVSRFSDTMEGHGGVVWYYLVALPLIIMPFGGLVVQMLREKNRGEGAFNRFLWFWFLLVFVLFSFSSTQLPHYLLYGITPLILLLAKHCGANPNRWLTLIPAILFAATLFFLPEILAKAVEQNPAEYFQGLLQQAGKVTGNHYKTAAGIYLLALLALLLWPKVQNFWRLAGAAVLQALFIVSVLIPVIAWIQQAPVKEAARFARHYLADSVVVMDGLNMPSFTVYRERITPQRPPQVGEYVFTKAGSLPPGEYQTVFKQGGVMLAKRVK